MFSYIYHNVIDATGDSAKTEEKVFEAVEDALVELVNSRAQANVC